MNEKRLSRYIDKLNTGRKPREHRGFFKKAEGEEEKLLATVRKTRKYAFFYAMAAVAAVILMVVSLKHELLNQNPSIVYAMEKAMKEIHSYHGILEVSETNELGETISQSRREVWANQEGNYYIKDLEGTSYGMVTVNNGEKKWQLRPEEKKVYLFSAFPDEYRFTFELGREVEDVTKAQTVNLMGTETISGRKTTKLQIIPDGGAAYYMWVDNETDLPLQKVPTTTKEPQIKVEVDMSVEENEQKSVDGGHSPWKLDPAFVAQVFASLLLSPEGIVGDYPIAYEDIEIIENNGTDTIAEIRNDKSIAKYVYLKRLIRQDVTGIWTVIGYDMK